jgi:cell division protein ZapA
MAHVQVTIAGRSYRMACGDGEEQHLEALAASFDAKIAEMRAAFGEIGDMRLHVMAALMTSDELSETKRRIEALEAELAAMRSVAVAQADRAETTERQLTQAVNKTADRIERLAARFAPPGPAAS